MPGSGLTLVVRCSGSVPSLLPVLGYTPTLTPGEEFSVCVTVTVRIPLVPEFVESNTATGQFVVVRDRYVDG